MFDEIVSLAAQMLGLTTAQVDEARDALLEEQASTDARRAATNALEHPEMSTTPLNEAHSRAQTRAAKLRKEVEKELPKVFGKLIALKVAEQRRDDIQANRMSKLGRTVPGEGTGHDVAVDDWWVRLHQHGVHPHNVKQQDNEVVAIIADLCLWKAADARFKDPANPWRSIFALYADRVIEKPWGRKKNKRDRSVIGTPERPRHRGGTEHYMFNEKAEELGISWSALVKEMLSEAPEDDEPTEYPFFDCSIYPKANVAEVEHVASLPSTDDVTNGDDGDDALAAPYAAADASDEEVGVAAEPFVAETSSARFPDYALPEFLTVEHVAAIERAAHSLIGDSYDVHLRSAIGDRLSTQPDAEIIAAVDSYGDFPRRWDEGPPLRYFLDEAREQGVQAGLEAFRAAAIARLMHLIATDSDFWIARDRLGLPG